MSATRAPKLSHVFIKALFIINILVTDLQLYFLPFLNLKCLILMSKLNPFLQITLILTKKSKAEKNIHASWTTCMKIIQTCS